MREEYKNDRTRFERYGTSYWWCKAQDQYRLECQRCRAPCPTQGARNQIASLPNGTVVDTIDEKHPVYDSVSNRNYVMISYTNKNGEKETGWVAASIVGLPRR